MRLVDADKIEYHEVWVETPIEGQHDACIMAYENSINELPTVEAIPIEWFETLVNNLKETDSFEKGIFLSDVIDMWRMEMAENGKYEIINTEGSYIIPDGVGGWKRADEKEVNYQYTTDTK